MPPEHAVNGQQSVNEGVGRTERRARRQPGQELPEDAARGQRAKQPLDPWQGEVVVDDHEPARAGAARERLDGSLRRRRVLDHPERDHDVEGGGRHGQRQDVSLTHEVARHRAAIGVVGLDGARQVHGEHACTGLEQDLREAPCAAAHFEDTRATQILQPASDTARETVLRDGDSSVGVELRRSVVVPLKTESVRVGLLPDEPGNPPADRESASARGAQRPVLVSLDRPRRGEGRVMFGATQLGGQLHRRRFSFCRFRRSLSCSRFPGEFPAPVTPFEASNRCKPLAIFCVRSSHSVGLRS